MEDVKQDQPDSKATPVEISEDDLNDKSRLTCLRCGMQFRRSWRMRKAHEIDCEGNLTSKQTVVVKITHFCWRGILLEKKPSKYR